MINIEKWLTQLVIQKGSDLFITVGVPPAIKINGAVSYLDEPIIEAEIAKQLLISIMNDKQMAEFLEKKELNFAMQNPEYGRFRVNVFQQKEHFGAVFRHIERRIPKLEALHMPKTLEQLALLKRGLILVVGGTGQGKSNTLAAMIGFRNKETSGHIVSIEDPIEFMHQHDKSIITQREVGMDTLSFQVALKNTFRQAPDVIVIGEIRDEETMQLAVAFAETGHLCIATLHANNANQALDRVIHFFPERRHAEIWIELSLNLRAIIAQQLIETKDNTTRYPAVEILINTPSIADRIRKGEIHLLKELMVRSNEKGMQTFDQSLYDLYINNIITYESALKHAESENDVRLLIKLNQPKQDKKFSRKFSLVDKDKNE